MKRPTAFIEMSLLRKGLLVTLTCGALTVLSPGAQAADSALPDDTPQITISTPNVKVVGRNSDLTPIEEATVTAHVSFDPVTLTTNSGVALLKDQVRTAAHRVCADADPDDVEDDDTCIRNALKDTDKQVDDAVTRARKSSVGS